MIEINGIEIPYSGTIELTEINTAVLDETTWTFPFTVSLCDELTEAIGYAHLPESHAIVGNKYAMLVELKFIRHLGECTVISITSAGIELSFLENTDFYTMAQKTRCVDLKSEIIELQSSAMEESLINPNTDYIFAPIKVDGFGEKLGLDFNNIATIDHSVVNQSPHSAIVIPFLYLNKAISKVFNNSGISVQSHSLKDFADIWLYNNLNLKRLLFENYIDDDTYTQFPDSGWGWLVSISEGSEPTVTVCYRCQDITPAYPDHSYYGEVSMPNNSLVSIVLGPGKQLNAQAYDVVRSERHENTFVHSVTFKLKNYTNNKKVEAGVELVSVCLENGIDLVGYEDFVEQDHNYQYLFTETEYLAWLVSRKCYSCLLVTVNDTSQLKEGMTILIETLGYPVIDQIVDSKSFRIYREELNVQIEWEPILNDGKSQRKKPWVKNYDFRVDIDNHILNWHNLFPIYVKSVVSEEPYERCVYNIGRISATHVIFGFQKVHYRSLLTSFVPYDDPMDLQHNNLIANLTSHMPTVTITDFLNSVKNALGLAILIQNKTAYIESWNYILSQNPIDISDLASEIIETQLEALDSYKLSITGEGNDFFKSVKEVDSYEFNTTSAYPADFPVDYNAENLLLQIIENNIYSYSRNYLSTVGFWKLVSYNYRNIASSVGNNTLAVESSISVPFLFSPVLFKIRVLSGGSVGSSFELIVGGKSYKYNYKPIPDTHKGEYNDAEQGLLYKTTQVKDAIHDTSDIATDFEITEGSGEWNNWIILKNRTKDIKKIEIGNCFGIALQLVEEKLDGFIPYLSQPGTFTIYEKELRPDTGVILCRYLGKRGDVYESSYTDRTPLGYSYNVPFTLEPGGDNGTYEKLWKAYFDWQIRHKKTVKSTIDFTEEIYLSGNWLRLFRIKQTAYLVKQIPITLNFGNESIEFGEAELLKV